MIFQSLERLSGHAISAVIKNVITGQCNSRVLIGLAAMVYQQLYHAREVATIKLFSGCPCKANTTRSSNISSLFSIKQLYHSHLLDMR